MNTPPEEPEQQGEQASPENPPVAVELSYRLWLVFVAISLAVAVIGFLTYEEVAPILAEQEGHSVAQERTSLLITHSVFLAMFLGAAAVARAMRRGASWARLLLAAFAAIVALGAVQRVFHVELIAALGPLSILGALLGLVSLVPLVVAVVYMYRPEARPYFTGQ